MQEGFASLFQSGFAFAAMVVFFGGSIFVHELGHFLAARLRGLKVLRFSIGFGPKIAAWKGGDGCEYRISLLPFGGYVALPQLADMGGLEGGSGAGGAADASLPKISCADKILVSAAGAFFNIIFALIIAAAVWAIGVPAEASQSEPVIGFVPKKIYSGINPVDSPAYIAGLAEGDRVLEVDSHRVSTFGEIAEAVAMGTGRSKDGRPECVFKVLRGGRELFITVNPALVPTNMRSGDSLRTVGVYPASGLVISEVMPGSPALKAGLKAGDKIVKIDGKPFYSNYQISEYLAEANGAKSVIEVLRGGNLLTFEAAPQKVVLTKPYASVSSKDGILFSLFCSTYGGEDAFSTLSKGTLRLLDGDFSKPELAGLNVGDVLLKVSENSVSSLSDFTTLFNFQSATNPVKLTFSALNGTDLREVAVPKGYSAKWEEPKFKYMLGYKIAEEAKVEHPGVVRQFRENIWRTWGALKSLFSPSSDIGLRHLTGPIGIGRAMYKFSIMDFSLALSFVVLININLAILNMLPIPVLDGGHIMFALAEKIMGRPVPYAVAAALQGGFMIFFLAVMAYVVYFDVARWRGDRAMESLSGVADSFYIKDVKFK